MFTKINRLRPMVTYIIQTKFKLNRMHYLDAIVFTHIHTNTHTRNHTFGCIQQRKISIMNSEKSQNIEMC